MTELTLKDVLEGMADHETRLLNLEGQHTPSDASRRYSWDETIPSKTTELKSSDTQRYATLEDLDKLRALFVNLKNQFNERSSKKKTGKERFQKYA